MALTTYKKDGTPKVVPVWIVELGDGRLGMCTSATSWKMKRLARNPAVQLQPCGVTGKPRSGTVAVAGTARIVEDQAEYQRVRKAVTAKYGFTVTIATVMGKVTKLFGKDIGTNAAIVITPEA